jgi:hypothetical protein
MDDAGELWWHDHVMCGGELKVNHVILLVVIMN